MRTFLAIAATLAPLTIAVPAMAADDSDGRCPDIASDQWMSIAEVASKLSGLGYEVREIERDDNCYEIEGVDANGARFEAYVNPETGEIVQPREKRS